MSPKCFVVVHNRNSLHVFIILLYFLYVYFNHSIAIRSESFASNLIVSGFKNKYEYFLLISPLFLPSQKSYSVSQEQPWYYFAVTKQPDIVNTAILNYSPVQHSIDYYTIKNSIAFTRLDNSSVTEMMSSNSVIQCSSAPLQSGALELSGKFQVVCLLQCCQFHWLLCFSLDFFLYSNSATQLTVGQ